MKDRNRINILGDKHEFVEMFPEMVHVEVAALLERVSNRKADSYVKLNVKMEDYYRIKDSAETENAEE